MVQNMITKETVEVLFEKAIAKGDSKVVIELLTAKPELVNTPLSDKYNTPLMEATELGHEEMVHILLKAGANVDTTTKDGCNALWISARYNRMSIAKVILSKITHGIESSPTSVDIKLPPLLYAVINKNTELTQLLRDKGAKYTPEIEAIEAANTLSAEINPSTAHQVIIDRLYEIANKCKLQNAPYVAQLFFERILQLIHPDNKDQINRIVEIKLIQIRIENLNPKQFLEKKAALISHIKHMIPLLKFSPSLHKNFFDTAIFFYNKKDFAIVNSLLQIATKFLPDDYIIIKFLYLSIIINSIFNSPKSSNLNGNLLSAPINLSLEILKQIPSNADTSKNFKNLNHFVYGNLALMSHGSAPYIEESLVLYEHAMRLKLLKNEQVATLLLQFMAVLSFKPEKLDDAKKHLLEACEMLSKCDSSMYPLSNFNFNYYHLLMQNSKLGDMTPLFLKSIIAMRIKQKNSDVTENYAALIAFHLETNPPNFKEANEELEYALKIPAIRYPLCIQLCKFYFEKEARLSSQEHKTFILKVLPILIGYYPSLKDITEKLNTASSIILLSMIENPATFSDFKSYLEFIVSTNPPPIEGLSKKKLTSYLLQSCGLKIFNRYYVPANNPAGFPYQQAMLYSNAFFEKVYYYTPSVVAVINLIHNIILLNPYSEIKINQLLKSSDYLFSQPNPSLVEGFFTRLYMIVNTLFDKKSYTEANLLFIHGFKLMYSPTVTMLKSLLTPYVVASEKHSLIHGLLEHMLVDKTLSFVVPILMDVIISSEIPYKTMLLKHALLQELTLEALTKDSINSYLLKKKSNFVEPTSNVNASLDLLSKLAHTSSDSLRHLSEQVLDMGSESTFFGNLSTIAEFNLTYDLRLMIALFAWHDDQFKPIPFKTLEKTLRTAYATLPKFSPNHKPLLKDIPNAIRNTAKIAFYEYRQHTNNKFTKEDAEIANKILAVQLYCATGNVFPSKILRCLIYKFTTLMAENGVYPNQKNLNGLVKQAMGIELHIKQGLKALFNKIESNSEQRHLSLLLIDQFNLMQKMGYVLVQDIDLSGLATAPQSFYKKISDKLERAFKIMEPDLGKGYSLLKNNQKLKPSTKIIANSDMDYPAQTFVDEQVVNLHFYDYHPHNYTSVPNGTIIRPVTLLMGGTLPITTFDIENWFAHQRFATEITADVKMKKDVDTPISDADVKQSNESLNSNMMLFSATHASASHSATASGGSANAAAVSPDPDTASTVGAAASAAASDNSASAAGAASSNSASSAAVAASNRPKKRKKEDVENQSAAPRIT